MSKSKQPTDFYTLSLTKEEAEFLNLGLMHLMQAAAVPTNNGSGFSSAIKEMHPVSYSILLEVNHGITHELLE